MAQREHRQIFPRPGWVEHDAEEIWDNVQQVVAGGAGRRRHRRRPGSPRSASPTSGRPPWSGTGPPAGRWPTPSSGRTPAPGRCCAELAEAYGEERLRARTGLPLATYFAGPKLRWLLDHVDGLRERAERGEVLFGTMDSWLIWKLTGRHVTDVTNASRTMLMDLRDPGLGPGAARRAGHPGGDAARRSAARPRSTAPPTGSLAGVPVASALGDQQAALFGQTCFQPGEAKCTYGTGSFLLLNTGASPVASRHGLLTTVGLPDRRPARRRTPWRARSRSPARWCSGCATTSA